MNDDQEWLSVAEAAKYTGLSQTQLRSWNRWGTIRSLPCGVSEELLGAPFSGERRQRGLCFRRADLEPFHVAWERGRPAREQASMVSELAACTQEAYDRWEAHSIRCRRRLRCPLAYLALEWGWEHLPDPELDEAYEGRQDLMEALEDIPQVAVQAMCEEGQHLYREYEDALAAEAMARAN